MNGNVALDGIDRDLKWMHRVGIGGFQIFDISLTTPQVIPSRIIYGSPEWARMFRHALKVGKLDGFDMAISSAPGWGETGGPWVRPEQGMKKLVWSETNVTGGQPFHGPLAVLPRSIGPFQNSREPDPFVNELKAEVRRPSPEYGIATRTIAYREPAASFVAKFDVRTSDGSDGDAAVLEDGDYNDSVDLKCRTGEACWIEERFAQAQTVQSASVTLANERGITGQFGLEYKDVHNAILSWSEDGETFTDLVEVPRNGAVQHTLAFAPVRARIFRLTFSNPANVKQFMGTPVTQRVAEWTMHGEARVNRGEEKAGFATKLDLYGDATPSSTIQSAIARDGIVDITSHVTKDGVLDWVPPPGRWTVLRFGYSLTGITNHPAPAEETGLEVDKLDAQAVESYFTTFLDNYASATGGGLSASGLRGVVTDSWEAGAQNWTARLPEEFARRRGYDLWKWAPVLAGRVVSTAGESDRFLWDFRETLEELLAENHYGTIARVAHAHGMLVYGESQERNRAAIGDGMDMKRYADVPMAAMWTQSPGVYDDEPAANADLRESSSIAHIYGRQIVAAESLTAFGNAYGWAPSTLKATADKELAMGLNRFVIHSSVHQPVQDKVPGLTLGPFGQWFNRNETWAEQAAPWLTYLARNSYLLQQGKSVADIAYFPGEGANLTAIFASKNPDIPAGYTYDYVNAYILQHEMTVRERSLVAPSGARYRAIVLDRYSQHMSVPVLRALHRLVVDGATLVGEAPFDTPSEADSPAEFEELVRELWGSVGESVRAVGEGRVLSGMDTAKALQISDVEEDAHLLTKDKRNPTLFVHRRTADTDIFFIDSRSDKPEHIEADLRVNGKEAELWHPDTGKTDPASYRISNGRTIVPLDLEPYETVFIVLRRPTLRITRQIPIAHERTLQTITGPWKLSFEAGRGAPAMPIEQPTLTSWTTSEDLRIRYYSGHGIYVTEFEASPKKLKKGQQLWLDLGCVDVLAEVRLNNRMLGTAWKSPYRVNIGNTLRPGKNKLEVRVANLWVNRLIGDKQPDATKIYSFTSNNSYHADSTLLPSGLIGPVRVVATVTGKIAQ